ncbi:DUF1499 domain-containing protein [Rhizobium sp. 9140]|uniref:DUF1499 domain-containing protein n=1 Tax=Rhizobium sp. 9140 TaxID=1761900 RepID=UPI000792D691|nr:DUF1499 domain-containing protein [Rhizobium sp. 9140]CZT34472.1 Protein of unknown function (DUF1499) [Rhizobium sp. 9140]
MITYERPISYAARWARHAARLAFVLFVLSLAAHRFGSLSSTLFVTLALVSAGLALVAVLLSVIGFVRLWQVAAVGGIASTMALLYASLPLAAAGLVLSQVVGKPAITDVSTDLATPPPFIRDRPIETGWLTPAAPVVADRQAQARAYPALTGRRYDGALDRVLTGVRIVADQSGIAIVAEEGLENAEPDFEDLALRAEPPANALRDAPDKATSKANGKVAGKTPTGKGGRDTPAARDPGPVPIPLSRPKQDAGPLPPGRKAGDILLQGESRSRIAGFRFDLVIRLREESETTFVDIRVASRLGRHDLGLDAATAERFLHALDAELLGIAGD